MPFSQRYISFININMINRCNYYMKKSIMSKSAKRMKMELIPDDWRYQGLFKKFENV